MYTHVVSMERKHTFESKLLRGRGTCKTVYVWFKKRGQSEKMWVRITKGSRVKGVGTLDNVPKILTQLKLFDKIKFKTDEEGITWGK